MNPPKTNLGDDYVMSHADIAEKLFLHRNTVPMVEKRAMQKFKEKMAEKGYKLEDLL
jgi:DNA-directed RNA polymerase specialized sigma24 family protein